MQNNLSCAIIQFEPFHEEIIPSLVHALNGISCRPTIYLHEQIQRTRGDLFAHMPSLNFDINYVPLDSKVQWENLQETVKRFNYDFVLYSTFQRDCVIEWAENTKIPSIGVVHNPKAFLNCAKGANCFKSKLVKIICLAPHVAAYLNQRLPHNQIDDIAVVESIYWGEIHEETFGFSQPLEIAITGGVNYTGRNFRGLLNNLSDQTVGAFLRERLKFFIVGSGKHRDDLEKSVEKKSLANCINFAPLGLKGRVDYEVYISMLKKTDIIHPLTPFTFLDYRESKITSSIPTAVGFGKPIVLDRWLAQVYRVPAIITDSSMKESLNQIASIDLNLLKDLRMAMLTYRNTTLEKNILEVKRIISRLFCNSPSN